MSVKKISSLCCALLLALSLSACSGGEEGTQPYDLDLVDQLAQCGAFSEELEPLYERFHGRFAWSNGRGWQAVQVLRTFGLVCVLNYFDCFSSLGTILGLFASLFTASNWSILWDGSLLELGLTGLDYGILAVGAAVLLGVSLVQRSGSVRAKVGALPYPARFVVWYGLFLVVLLMGAYGIGYDASQFIYNQF